MPWVRFVWNDEIAECIALHGVTREEVVLRSKKVRNSQSMGRLAVLGEMTNGKFLVCVFVYVDTDVVIPVTAYEIDE